MKVELDLSFLEELLGAIGPSGFENEAAKVWKKAAEEFADEVWEDTNGNVYAQLNPGKGGKLLLDGHIDEIGLIVTDVDEKGFVYVQGLGGWDPQVLVGQRVRFLGKKGEVIGVVGRKAAHLLKEEDQKRAVRVEDLWVDLGADSREEALSYVEVGTVGVLSAPLRYLHGRRIVSKALDNRIGAFVVLEALRHLRDAGVQAEVTAVASTQEEVSGAGALAAAFRLRPKQAIVVDVTHCTRIPGVEKKTAGQAELGKGPDLSVGPYLHPELVRRLRAIAEREAIPYTVSVESSHTRTNADAIALSREGVPTAVVSVPNRYMHSPSEMVDLGDVEHAVKLLALYGLELSEIEGRR